MPRAEPLAEPGSTPGGALVISLDFELHWGVRDKRSVADYRENLLGARAAVGAMLDLFTEFGVHATWAVVGLLFAESKREMLARMPSRRPGYRRATLSPAATLAEVGQNERDDPFHFAPSLIRRIAATPGQEIGTHTFSHYYCLEAGQTPAEFRDDLAAAVAVTRDKLGRVPRSIAFPRNQVSAPHVGICGELGLVAYRGNQDHWAYRERRDEDERLVRRAVRLADAYVPLTAPRRPSTAPDGAPVNVAASRYLRPDRPLLRRLEPLRLHRLFVEMRRAAREREVYHLWWHPHDFGAHLPENLAMLRRILTHFRALGERYGMATLTMAEAAARGVGATQPAMLRRPDASYGRATRSQA